MADREIPAVYMRGGTSRALIFHRGDLPHASPEDDYAAWAPIFLRAIGSPDPGGRQLDGLGGGISSLSKVAVIGPPSRPDADVDYTFGQVGVFAPTVGYRGNCGNISSAVGPFAVDEGLVAADGDTAWVCIHNTNTGKMIHATFPVENGRAAVDGDFELQGVAGTGAPIRLDFMEPAGATTGRMLPTGNPSDLLEMSWGTVEASLIDIANPVCYVAAADLGLSGRETPQQLASDSAMMDRFRALRVAAAVAIGLSPDANHARSELTNLPLVCIVARPDPAQYEDDDRCDIVVRMISSDQPHKASPLTGALCTAAALVLEESVVRRHRGRDLDTRNVRIRHPAGLLPLAVRAEERADGVHIASVSAFRTARRLMKGTVFC